MSKIEYFYVPLPYLDIKTKSTKYILRPYIPLRLGYNHSVTQQLFDCLLDSGADENLFPAQIGEALGINIKKGKPKKHIGIGSSTMEAYEHTISLYLGTIYIKTKVDFSFTQQVQLLGRNGFFRFFPSIEFRESEKKVVITTS